jgi:hypothetical protein
MADQPWRLRTALIQGPPGPVGTFAEETQAWTPPSIASGQVTSTTVAFTQGVTVGMQAWACANVVLTPGYFLTSQVTATNVVTVTAVNLTGGAYTPGALILKVSVSVN